MLLHADVVLLNEFVPGSGLHLKPVAIHNLENQDVMGVVSAIQRPEWIALMNVEVGTNITFKTHTTTPLTLVINTSHKTYPLQQADEYVQLKFGDSMVDIRFHHFILTVPEIQCQPIEIAEVAGLPVIV